MKTLSFVYITTCLTLSFSSIAWDQFNWPNGTKAAVSLSYDDALDSHLDNAIPALDMYNLKGSFYLTLSSSVVKARLEEWRTISKNGHELGNHTLNHACRGSLAGRGWVAKHNDLDTKYLAEIVHEVRTANTFLTAIDGHTEHTFTVPCTDQIVENKNYTLSLHNDFVGIKSHVGNIPQKKSDINRLNMPVLGPVNVSGETLINYVKQAAKQGTIANFTFHGIGGDHLSISTHAHKELLQYLAKNKNIYWVDTFRNISLYVKNNQN